MQCPCFLQIGKCPLTNPAVNAQTIVLEQAGSSGNPTGHLTLEHFTPLVQVPLRLYVPDLLWMPGKNSGLTGKQNLSPSSSIFSRLVVTALLPADKMVSLAIFPAEHAEPCSPVLHRRL